MAVDHRNKRDCEVDEERLSLAFKKLDRIPPSLLNQFALSIRTLDLSHNKFNNLSFLKNFQNLTCLILDHNNVNSATTFPTLQSLQILWLNHNQITRLFPFIQRLKTAFPKLKYLSMMSNEAVPMNVDDSTFYQYLQYRLFVISWFLALEHLDDKPVTKGEKAEALRLYKRPLLERFLNVESVRKVVKSMGSAIGLRQNTDSGRFI